MEGFLRVREAGGSWQRRLPGNPGPASRRAETPWRSGPSVPGCAGGPVRGGLRFAFGGRVSTEDWQDPVTSRARQRDQAGVLVARRGIIVAEFFDSGHSRTLRWAKSALEGDPGADPPGPPHVDVWRSARAHDDTKTRKSRRALGMPRMAVAALREHLERQAAARRQAGVLWEDNGGWSSPQRSGLNSMRPMTRFPLIMRIGPSLLSGKLEDDGVGHPAALAHGLQSVPGSRPAHVMDQRCRDPGA